MAQIARSAKTFKTNHMKHILILFISALIISSCLKSSGLPGNGTKLMAISNDSAGAWQFGYTGNYITSIGPDPSLSPPYNQWDVQTCSIQYTNLNSFEYVSLSFVEDTLNWTINYTLTPSKLPLRIAGDINAEFIYLPNTNLLDSVILYSGSDQLIFNVTYTGQNITEVTESQVLNNQNTVIGTYTYTYTTTPNVFRQTDSLLYIYSYPQTPFDQSPVIAAFFAETFSASTFDSLCTYGPINYTGVITDTISGKMTYSLNADGKITEESFGNNYANFCELAAKKYYYQ